MYKDQIAFLHSLHNKMGHEVETFMRKYPKSDSGDMQTFILGQYSIIKLLALETLPQNIAMEELGKLGIPL